MPLTWTLKQWLQTNRAVAFSSDRPLRHLKELQETIRQRTGNKIQVLKLHHLLEKPPITLDCRILQIICDAFQFELKDFCTITPAGKRILMNFQHLLQPCAIGGSESLHSFIIRVQLAAISQALLMTGNNMSKAARLLGSNRITLLSIRQRSHQASKDDALSIHNAIPLPANTFTIRENEDFMSLKRRIQLAAMLETIKLEGNHSRAALRLRYRRTSSVALRHRLENKLSQPGH